jgi:hypothetical protein
MKIKGISAIFFIAVCIFTSAASANMQEQSSSEQDTLIGMPNPSAVWAEEMEYEYLIRTNADGSQYGVCVLPDGSERDAWDLFRQSSIVEPDETMIGMPDPSAIWASQVGYGYLIRTNADGSQYGICVLPDGSEYDSWTLFREHCGIPGPTGLQMVRPQPSMGSPFSKETGARSLMSARLSGLIP